MMYFNVLINGILLLFKFDEKICVEIIIQVESLGWFKLYDELCCVDFVSGVRIYFNDL